MKNRLPEFVLIVVTFLWGGTFLATRIALQDSSPVALVALRFAIGFAIVGLFVRRRPTRAELSAGVAIGTSMVVAYLLQCSGLRFTSSSKSAFLTTLYVPLVPLLQLVVTGRRPSGWTIAGTVTCFVGLVFLSARGSGDFSIGLGEWLTLGGAVASAAQILLIGRFARSGDTTQITAVQLAVVALASMMLLPLDRQVHIGPQAAVIAAGLGLVATGGVLWAMNWAQKSVSPARATLIYAMEPVWAAIIGHVAGERLPAAGMAGGLLVLGGILMSELGPYRVRQRARNREIGRVLLPEPVA